DRAHQRARAHARDAAGGPRAGGRRRLLHLARYGAPRGRERGTAGRHHPRARETAVRGGARAGGEGRRGARPGAACGGGGRRARAKPTTLSSAYTTATTTVKYTAS